MHLAGSALEEILGRLAQLCSAHDGVVDQKERFAADQFLVRNQLHPRDQVLKVFIQTLVVFLFRHLIHAVCFILIHLPMYRFQHVHRDSARKVLDFPVRPVRFLDAPQYSGQFVRHICQLSRLYRASLTEAA